MLTQIQWAFLLWESSQEHRQPNQSFYKQIKAWTDSVAECDKQDDTAGQSGSYLAQQSRRSVQRGHCLLFVVASRDGRRNELAPNRRNSNRLNEMTKQNAHSSVGAVQCLLSLSLWSICQPMRLKKSDTRRTSDVISRFFSVYVFVDLN